MAIQSTPYGGKLHGVSLSPFVRKVRAVLEIKGIEYDLIPVMPGAMDSSFLAKSPLSKCPYGKRARKAQRRTFCCLTRRRSVPISTVPCPTPRSIQPDAAAFGMALFWEEYGDTRVVESSSVPFIQRFVQTKVFKQECDEELVRRYVDEILPAVQDQIEELYMESGVPNARDPKVVDFSIWTSFVNLEHAGVPLDADRWPKLGEYLAVMNEHSALGKILEEERSTIASLG